MKRYFFYSALFDLINKVPFREDYVNIRANGLSTCEGLLSIESMEDVVRANIDTSDGQFTIDNLCIMGISELSKQDYDQLSKELGAKQQNK